MNELHDTLAAAFLTVLAVGVAAAGSAHAVLNKRDVRAAIGWVGLMWLVPFAGVALYGLFGINRIRRRATGLRPQRLHPRPPGGEPVPQPRLDVTLPAGAGHLAAIGTLVDAIAPSPLTDGNAITPIADGVEAYRAMLDAIEGARQTIGMATYIFDNDAAGRRFAETLAAAVRRDAGRRRSARRCRSRPDRRRRRAVFVPHHDVGASRMQVPVAEFLPTFVPLHLPYANLRNHRKLLIVDGQ